MIVYSATRPEFYTIEHTHDNKLVARFAEEVTEIEIGDGIPGYEYEETVGEYPWSNSLATRIRKNPDKFLALLKAGN